MSRFRYFTRDDEQTELEVEYSFDGGSLPSGLSGPPEYADPGSPPEVTIEDAWRVADENSPNAPRIEMTDEEVERFEREVLADPETYEPEDCPYD